MADEAVHEYADIHAFEATTGAIYLFSDRSLTEDRAREHAEWIEVGQYEDKNQ